MYIQAKGPWFKMALKNLNKESRMHQKNKVKSWIQKFHNLDMFENMENQQRYEEMGQNFTIKNSVVMLGRCADIANFGIIVEDLGVVPTK